MRSLLFSLLLLLVLVSRLDAQDEPLTPYMWHGDTTTVLAPWNITAQDHEFCQIKPYGSVEWNLPGAPIDSVSVVVDVPSDAELLVTADINASNSWIIGRLKGPLPYGEYSFAFSAQPNTTPRYLGLTAPQYRDDQSDNSAEFSAVDAAFAHVVGAGVEVTEIRPEKRVRWYTMPLIQDTGFRGTASEAAQTLPKNVHFITSDGKQYVFGR